MKISNRKKRIKTLRTNVELWNWWRKMFKTEYISLGDADFENANLEYASLDCSSGIPLSCKGVKNENR